MPTPAAFVRQPLPQIGDPDSVRRAELTRLRTALEQILARFTLALNALIGAAPILGAVTLGAGATTTTILDSRVTTASRPFFTATTPNAAAETLALYALCTAGTVTITHNNLASVDRTFHYAIFP